MPVDPEAGGPARAMHSVEGRVIIVTGSGQGVGRGMANHLGKAGASIVVAEWNAEKMHRTVGELTALGVPAIAVPLPVEGAPLGVQLTAGWGRDDALVAVAAELEALLA